MPRIRNCTYVNGRRLRALLPTPLSKFCDSFGVSKQRLNGWLTRNRIPIEELRRLENELDLPIEQRFNLVRPGRW